MQACIFQFESAPDEAGCSASLVLSADVPADDDFLPKPPSEDFVVLSDELLTVVEEPLVVPFELVPDLEEADVRL